MKSKSGQNLYVPALPNENVGDEYWPTHGGVGALRETETEHLETQAALLSKGAVFSGLEIASSVLFDEKSLPELTGIADYKQVVMNQRVTFTLTRASLFLYEWASDSGASLHPETLLPWLRTIYGAGEETVLKDRFLEDLFRTLGHNLRAALSMDIYRDRGSRLPHNWGPNLELIDLGGLRRVSESWDIREWDWILMYVEACLSTLAPRTSDGRQGPYMASFFRGRYFFDAFLPAIFSGEELVAVRQYFEDLKRQGRLDSPTIITGQNFIQRIRTSVQNSKNSDKAMQEPISADALPKLEYTPSWLSHDVNEMLKAELPNLFQRVKDVASLATYKEVSLIHKILSPINGSRRENAKRIVGMPKGKWFDWNALVSYGGVDVPGKSIWTTTTPWHGYIEFGLLQITLKGRILPMEANEKLREYVAEFSERQPLDNHEDYIYDLVLRYFGIDAVERTAVKSEVCIKNQAAIDAVQVVPGSDPAMNSTSDKDSSTGGIDFNPDKLDINAKGDNLTFTVDPAMLQRMQNASGLNPVIIGMLPLTDLSEFLGASK